MYTFYAFVCGFLTGILVLTEAFARVASAQAQVVVRGVAMFHQEAVLVETSSIFIGPFFGWIFCRHIR